MKRIFHWEKEVREPSPVEVFLAFYLWKGAWLFFTEFGFGFGYGVTQMQDNLF